MVQHVVNGAVTPKVYRVTAMRLCDEGRQHGVDPYWRVEDVDPADPFHSSEGPASAWTAAKENVV